MIIIYDYKNVNMLYHDFFSRPRRSEKFTSLVSRAKSLRSFFFQ